MPQGQCCYFSMIQNLSYKIIMRISPTSLPKTLLILLFIYGMNSLNCGPSVYDFTGTYTIGKQDELNRTFTKIQGKLPTLPTVTYNTSATISYTITNATAAFYYRDSKQKAEILGNNTIVVEGGQLQVDFAFNWSKKSIITRNGTGAAAGVTGEIVFAKFAVLDEDGFLSYDLLDTQNLTWGLNPFQISRVDPADASDEDKQALTDMINNLTDALSLRQFLEIQIDKIYQYYLRNSLHEEHEPISKQFDYVWKPQGKPNVTISFNRKPLRVDIQRQGISLSFDVQAQNATQWVCGDRNVPFLAFNTRVFGHTQQFLSYDFYQNVLRYAIRKGLLDTSLNRQDWQSRLFQFYAGDLYQILAKVQDRFYASSAVTGSCKGQDLALTVTKGSDDTINASVYFSCELKILTETVVKFAVGLHLEVQGVPLASQLNFRIRKHDEFISLYGVGDYKVINEVLAKAMISASINRLYRSYIFGSGWPMSPPRDYPHFVTDNNFTFVYDSGAVSAEAGYSVDEE